MLKSFNTAYYHYEADTFGELPNPCCHSGTSAYVVDTGKHYVGTVHGWQEVGAVPVGSIVMWQESETVPTGWALCDGQEDRPNVNVAGEPSLVAIIKV